MAKTKKMAESGKATTTAKKTANDATMKKDKPVKATKKIIDNEKVTKTAKKTAVADKVFKVSKNYVDKAVAEAKKTSPAPKGNKPGAKDGDKKVTSKAKKEEPTIGMQTLISGMGGVVQENTKALEPLFQLGNLGVKDYANMRTIYMLNAPRLTTAGLTYASRYRNSCEFMQIYNTNILTQLSGLRNKTTRPVFVYLTCSSWNGNLKTTTCVLKFVNDDPESLINTLVRSTAHLGKLLSYIVYNDGTNLKLKGVTSNSGIMDAEIRYVKRDYQGVPPKAFSTYRKVSEKVCIPMRKDIRGAIDIYGRE